MVHRPPWQKIARTPMIEAVQVFHRGQTGFPVRHILYDGVGFAKFIEFERNEHLIFQKIFILFSVLSVGKIMIFKLVSS